MDDHSRYKEDLAAYMLGALEPDQAGEFERHLQECAECQAEERWLRAAVDVLPSSVEQVEPPPELRERLMATVRAEARSATAPSRERARPRRRFNLLMRPAVAFGAMALLAVGVAGGYLIADGGDGGSSRTVAAQPTGVQPGAGGQVVAEDGGAIVNVSGLRQERGRVYQVWLRRDGSNQVEPSSLFGVHSDGSGAAAIPGGVDGVAEVMVSSEPARGSARPTTDPVLRITL
jgi:anti-sigma factor RsiW